MTYRTLTKAFYDDTMNSVQTLNGIRVSSHQTSARGLNVQVVHHEVRLVNTWKVCIESVTRSAYI